MASHVINDLGRSTVKGGVVVVDNDGASIKGSDTTQTESCGVGIESTVAKIDAESGEIIVFRRGGVSQTALQAVIDKSGFADSFAIRCLSKKASESQKGLQAPGQMLTHYAPDVETYLVRGVDAEGADGNQLVVTATPVDDDRHQIGEKKNGITLDLAKCVVIDFHGILSDLRELQPLAYRDMSEVRFPTYRLKVVLSAKYPTINLLRRPCFCCWLDA